MAMVTVTYGNKDQFKVQFKLDRNGNLLGRYLEPTTPWEHRSVTTDNAMVVLALTQVLVAYRTDERISERP